MIVIDTSVWVEFFRGNSDIFSSVSEILEKQSVLAVECVFGELLQGAGNQREIKILHHYWENLPKKEETGLWLEAGELSVKENLFRRGVGLIDAFLIVFARRHQGRIWTLDKKLRAVLAKEEQY